MGAASSGTFPLLMTSNRLDESRWLANLKNRRYDVPKVLGTISVTVHVVTVKKPGCVDSTRLPTQAPFF